MNDQRIYSQRLHPFGITAGADRDKRRGIATRNILCFHAQLVFSQKVAIRRNDLITGAIASLLMGILLMRDIVYTLFIFLPLGLTVGLWNAAWRTMLQSLGIKPIQCGTCRQRHTSYIRSFQITLDPLRFRKDPSMIPWSKPMHATNAALSRLIRSAARTKWHIGACTKIKASSFDPAM